MKEKTEKNRMKITRSGWRKGLESAPSPCWRFVIGQSFFSPELIGYKSTGHKNGQRRNLPPEQKCFDMKRIRTVPHETRYVREKVIFFFIFLILSLTLTASFLFSLHAFVQPFSLFFCWPNTAKPSLLRFSDIIGLQIGRTLQT